ncbi:MFS transporter [Streptomyces sp. DSM 41987]|uniref:MFS transporter n=1 Tax=Streptomyces TaxID=1883 RepID=UPI00361878FF
MEAFGPVRALLQHAPFRNQLLASTLSMLGNSLTPVALSFGILEVTGSASALGFVLAAYTLPQVAFMLIGGVWADRLPRQRVMMISDAVRVTTQCGMGYILLTHQSSILPMVILQGACGISSAFFLPASTGLVADTVPSGRFQEANALLSLSRTLTGSVGPMVAGVIVAFSGAGWALLFDGFTYAASFLFLSRLSIPSTVKTTGANRFWVDLRSGWHEVRSRSWVWTTIMYCMVFNVSFTSFQVLGPTFLTTQAHGAVFWGMIVTGLGLGQFAGSSLAMWWHPKRPLFIGRLVMLLAAPVLYLMSAGASVLLLVCGSILSGIAMSFPDTLWESSLQENISGDSLSRVSSFDFLGSLALRPIGLALAGMISDLIGSSATFALCGSVIVVVGMMSLADPGVRRLTSARFPKLRAQHG